MNKDTIVAIATVPAKSAIAIIRVSGKDTFKIINKISEKNVSKKGNVIDFGYICNGNERVDQVLFMKFVAPHSFTGEDSIEINCHGGQLIIEKIISLIIKNGARVAKPGEFTMRAMMNNKIDLTQAEAIHELVNATNDYQQKISISSLDGKTSKLIKGLIDKVSHMLGLLEVNIDFPEYEDAKNTTKKNLLENFTSILIKIDSILNNSFLTRKINRGIKTAIVGQPNVGKSTLLNALLNEQKAIVTNIPGTTRDFVEGFINIGSLTLNIIDTAGIRKAKNKIEQIGIAKSKQLIKDAELVLHVVDGTKKWSKQDSDIQKLLINKKNIVVFNKSDIKISKQSIENINTVNISAKRKNIRALIDSINSIFELNKIKINDFETLNNDRQIALLENGKEILLNVIKNLKNNQYLETLTVDLEDVIYSLREIIGENKQEDIYELIFSKFCLGK